MMNKLSPGPWEWVWDDSCMEYELRDKRGRRVLSDETGANHALTRNGALIAAAPYLLAALENLLAEFDRYDAAMTEIGRGHEDYGGQREAARVAIAKAKGEA